MAGSSPVARAELVKLAERGLTTEQEMRKFLVSHRYMPEYKTLNKLIRRVLRSGAARQALDTIMHRRTEDKYNPANWGGKRGVVKETRKVNGVLTTRIIPT